MEISRPDKNEPLRIARITKQKEGLEGLEFGFKLENIVLGYDDDGDPVSSCVPVFVDLAAAKKEKEKQPKGGNEEALIEAFDLCKREQSIRNQQPLHGHGAGELIMVKRQSLIDEAIKRVDGNEKQKSRKVRDALRSLIGREAFYETEDYIYQVEWI
jgi:hypothetical protein